MHDTEIISKKYYFSFDSQVVAKKFTHAQDFVAYIQLSLGVDFMTDGILLLNEMHYSPDIYTILSEYLMHPSYRVKIVAT